MFVLSGSRMLRILECPASKDSEDIEIKFSDGKVTDIGTVIHEIAKWKVDNNTAVMPDLEPYIKRYGFDEKDVKDLTYLSFRVNDVIKLVKQNARIVATEESFSFEEEVFTCQGTADLVAIENDDTLIILDYKSGYVERDASPQTKFYALGMLETKNEFLNFKKVKTIVAWLRTGTIDIVDYTRDEILNWWEQSLKNIMENDSYNPGTCCEFCPRRMNCPALQIATYNTVYSLMSTEVNQVSTKQLFDLYPHVKNLEKVIEQYHKLIRVEMLKGEQVDSNGNRFGLNTISIKTLDFGKSVPCIKTFFNANEIPLKEIDKALSISKSKVFDIIKEHSKRGVKTAKCEEFMAICAEQNAINESQQNRIQIKKEKKK